MHTYIHAYIQNCNKTRRRKQHFLSPFWLKAAEPPGLSSREFWRPCCDGADAAGVASVAAEAMRVLHWCSMPLVSHRLRSTLWVCSWVLDTLCRIRVHPKKPVGVPLWVLGICWSRLSRRRSSPLVPPRSLEPQRIAESACLWSWLSLMLHTSGNALPECLIARLREALIGYGLREGRCGT